MSQSPEQFKEGPREMEQGLFKAALTKAEGTESYSGVQAFATFSELVNKEIL